MYKNSKYSELASECYKNTNFLNLTNKNMIYLYHILFAIIVIYYTIVEKKTSNNIPILLLVILISLSFIILLQIKFDYIITNAQKCAAPTNKNILWNDNTKLWYKNIQFFFIVWFTYIFTRKCISI